MISFVILPKNETENILPSLFRILHSNMSVIAPTGNSYDEDYRFWHNSVAPALEKDARQIILIYDDAEIIGYFQYYVNATTFMMEEIQFRKKYHGTGLFQLLYSYLFEIIPPETLYMEAYAHKQNQKSQGILKHLGLQIIGENKNGNSYHFRGDCHQTLKKYNARESSIREMTLRKAPVKSYLGKIVDISIDRPIGSVHPKHDDIIYPINYGFIPKVLGGDGEELDVYLLGVDTPVKEYSARIIGIVHRHNDVEDKLVAAPEGISFTVEEITEAVRFQEQYYDSEIEVNE